MAFNYPKAAATALRLIANFGESCSIMHASMSATAQPWKDEGVTYESKAVTMAFLTVDKENRRSIQNGETEQREGECLAYLGQLDGWELSGKDVVIRADGTELRIKSIDKLNPAGIPVLYTLELQA